jgi:ATP-dependent Clp protease ATP-binding subunit ClpA
MFELYTERARRVIFFSRYEASQFGSTTIETHHLLLGLLREDKNLMGRLIGDLWSVESLMKEIRSKVPASEEKVPTSVDLPLSNECKHILAYAHEEAELLAHRHIGSEHLLLGLLREKDSLAAGFLIEKGLKLEAIREKLAHTGLASEGIRPLFLHLTSDTLVGVLEKHNLALPRQHLTNAVADRVGGDVRKAQAELQLFLESLIRQIRERARGDAALLSTFEEFDWRASVGGFRSGLSEDEDWKFAFGLTLLAGELLMARYEQHT